MRFGESGETVPVVGHNRKFDRGLDILFASRLPLGMTALQKLNELDGWSRSVVLVLLIATL